MAFNTLLGLRNKLNDELGLLSDADNAPFGTPAQRNAHLINAIARLWPSVARLTRESFTTTNLIADYTLTTLVDVERIEIIDPAAPGIPSGRGVRSWSLYEDESGDPPVKRLQIPGSFTSGLTLRAIGYVPYTLPAVDADPINVPPRLEWLVIAGARAEALRRTLARFANYERFQNENRSNALTPADVIELLRDARADWNRGLTENARNLAAPHRAMLTTS